MANHRGVQAKGRTAPRTIKASGLKPAGKVIEDAALYELRYIETTGHELIFRCNSLVKLEGWLRYDSVDTYVIMKNNKLYRIASRGEVTRYK